jgi:hypothetical protein
METRRGLRLHPHRHDPESHRLRQGFPQKPAAEFGISVALNGDGKAPPRRAKRDSAAKGVNGKQDDKSAVDAGAAYVYY